MPPLQSLRLRLPLLITALLIVVVSTFLWVTYREGEVTLVRAGGGRATSAAGQVANLIERSARAAMENLRRAAAEPAVRQNLPNPRADTRDAARTRLAP